jgi:hypothetical protein
MPADGQSFDLVRGRNTTGGGLVNNRVRTLIMETRPANEMLVYLTHLTQLSAREDFAKFRRRESFKTYKIFLGFSHAKGGETCIRLHS